MGSNPPQGPGWGGDPSQGGGYVPPAPTNLPPPAPRPTNLPGGGLTGADARATVGPQAIPQAVGAPTGPVRQLVEPPPPPREGANPFLIAAIIVGTLLLLGGAGGWYFFIRSPDPVKVETAASGSTAPKGTAAPSGVDRTNDTGPTGTNIGDEAGTTIPAPPGVGVPTTTQAPSSGGGGGNRSSGGGNSGGGGGGGGNVAPPPSIVTTTQTTQPPAPKILSFSVTPTSITCKPGDDPGIEMLWSTANTQTVTLVIDGASQKDFAPNNQPTGYGIDCHTHTAAIEIMAIGANNQFDTRTVNVSVLRLIN